VKRTSPVTLNNMKNRIIGLSVATAAFVFSGCASSRDATSSRDGKGFPPLQTVSSTPEHIVLKTFGRPGQQFCGFLNVDGVRREVAGVTPAEYPLDCVVVSGVVTNSIPDERFGFEVSRKNGQFYTPGTDRVCVFRYHAGALEILTAR
jgi:hypothetical protein